MGRETLLTLGSLQITPQRRGERATYKLEDEEQVGEGGENREAAGQGAAPRRRCGGHAGGLRRTRGSAPR